MYRSGYLINPVNEKVQLIPRPRRITNYQNIWMQKDTFNSNSGYDQNFNN